MIKYQYIEIKSITKYLIITIIKYNFKKSIKQLMFITNINIKSKILKIKTKKIALLKVCF